MLSKISLTACTKGHSHRVHNMQFGISTRPLGHAYHFPVYPLPSRSQEYGNTSVSIKGSKLISGAVFAPAVGLQVTVMLLATHVLPFHRFQGPGPVQVPVPMQSVESVPWEQPPVHSSHVPSLAKMQESSPAPQEQLMAALHAGSVL